eukprot:2506981-Prymnesium_polylepis.1
MEGSVRAQPALPGKDRARGDHAVDGPDEPLPEARDQRPRRCAAHSVAAKQRSTASERRARPARSNPAPPLSREQTSRWR